MGRPVTLEFEGRKIVVRFDGLTSLLRIGIVSGRPLEPLLRLLLRNRIMLKASVSGRFEQELLPNPSLTARILSRNLRRFVRENLSSN